MNEQLERILIVGPAWVGDMVMAQTLFILLKQQNPEVQIDVLAPNWTLSLVERMPEVTRSIPLSIGHKQLALSKRWAISKALRSQFYHQAIILPQSFKSALIPFWAKIAKRTGWLGEFRFGVLNDYRKLDKKQYPLMIQRFAALAYSPQTKLPSNLPKPKFFINPISLIQTLSSFNLSSKDAPILALCPGAEFGSSKRWPESHYSAIANEKLAEGWQVWLFGSPKDKRVTERINHLTHNRCVDLAGKTHLNQAIELMSIASLVVTNDSGLMHIAAALNLPLVAIYGSTSPTFTPPLQENARIIALDLKCRPCFKRDCPLQHHQCMQLLKPDQVLDIIKHINFRVKESVLE